MITVAIDGLFAPALEGGLPRDALDAVCDELRHAHRELMSRRDADVGFYDVPTQSEVLRAVHAEVTRLRSLADDLIVLGIGGSSMGGQAILAAFEPTLDRSFRVHFVDNVDPDTLGGLLERLEPPRTAVIAVTKSGETVETLAQLLILRRWLRVTLGQGEMRARMTFVTDPAKGLLHELAQQEGIRSFAIPANVGGRYSVLTPVGLLPAAFAGVDVDALLAGGAAMVERVTADELTDNPACTLAAGAVLAQQRLGRQALVYMPYSDALRHTGQWFVQLWAESLGKRQNRLGQEVRAGQIPIAAVGATDQHAQLQLFVDGPPVFAVLLLDVATGRAKLPVPDELSDRPEVGFLHGRDLAEVLAAERRATRAALLDAGTPVIDLRLERLDAATLGGLFVLLEAACACTGIVMGINPFDQPGVEVGKRMALGLLGKPGYEGERERLVAREAKTPGR